MNLKKKKKFFYFFFKTGHLKSQMILFQCVLRSIHKTVTEFSASKIHFQGGNFDQFFDCLKKVLIFVIIHFKMRI